MEAAETRNWAVEPQEENWKGFMKFANKTACGGIYIYTHIYTKFLDDGFGRSSIKVIATTN
jgi:hypothetical protein